MAKAAVKSDNDIKRHPINVRTTLKVRNLLEAAAAASGRSMSQELEFRIERSLDREGMVAEMFGSRVAGEVLTAVGTTLRHIDRLLAKYPVALAKVNGEDQIGMDDGLQASAAVIALLEAINGLEAKEIVDLASGVLEREPMIWRDAAIAATAQSLGLTLVEATKRVDKGGDPPKTAWERLNTP